MKEEKTEGITLQSISFKERSKIITLLTKDFGIVPLFVKDISPKHLSLMSLTSLFCCSEIVYKKTGSDLGTLIEGTVIDNHFFLRKDLSFLQAAGNMIQAVLQSQFPDKKAYGIYTLLKKYLSKIALNPLALAASFTLKLLSFEELLSLKENCSICSAFASSIYRGESLCNAHVSPFAFNFSEDDFKRLLILTYAKNFTVLQDLDVSLELQEKIKLLFKDLT